MCLCVLCFVLVYIFIYNLCTYYLSEGIIERGVVKGKMAAGVCRLAYFSYRARDQITKDAIIDQAIIYVTIANNLVPSPLTPDSLVLLFKFIKTNLGYTGTFWEGSVGDLVAVLTGSNSNNSSGDAESMFGLYWKCCAGNILETNIKKLLLEVYILT